MRQIIQNLKTGQTSIVEVPAPSLKTGHILIKSVKTLISSGTEKSLVDFGKANFIQKIKKQPEKAKLVLEKAKTDGVIPTVEAVKAKLEDPLPLGYSNFGIVLESAVDEFKPGDRVISNGNHAEVVCVPQNLVAKVPDNVTDEEASFVVVSSIALQGVRLIKPTIGETFVVLGLGIIGLLTVQVLKANGCQVIAADFEEERCKLATEYGAKVFCLSDSSNFEHFCLENTNGVGIDGVLICASTTTNQPVSLASKICRKKGRIVLIGVVGLELSRKEFYDKEITFQVSCSYGPGRYDEKYEKNGHDYPIGYVRWTEKRNFEAVINLFAEKKISVENLISKRFDLTDVSDAYSEIFSTKCLGLIIEYPQKSIDYYRKNKISLTPSSRLKPKYSRNNCIVGHIGAGNYGAKVLLPALRKTGACLDTIVTQTGLRATNFGQKFNFAHASSDVCDVFSSERINTTFIATRHDSHASLVIDALKSGKNVFVEKPLALNLRELDEIEKAYHAACSGILMVGYNRRFSPLVRSIKDTLDSVRSRKNIVITFNAGYIDPSHWIQNAEVGGKRIIGEACHAIDLARFIIGKPIMNFKVVSGIDNRSKRVIDDDVVISLLFEDGSTASINYFSNGSKAFIKERVELYTNGSVVELKNFKALKVYGDLKIRSQRLLKQNKGNFECVSGFVNAVENGLPSPISFEEILEVSRISIDIANTLKL